MDYLPYLDVTGLDLSQEEKELMESEDREIVLFHFKQYYQNSKGFIAACTKDNIISVYIKSLDHIDLYPKEFFTFKCEYTICPDGLNPGCD